MLVIVGVAVGLAAVAEDRLGPLHEYMVAPPAGVAVSVTVPPLQMGPLLVGAAVGVAFTVTLVVYTVAGAQPGLPLPSLTVSEYTEVAVGVAVGFWPVDVDRLEPLHEYTDAPPDGLAVRFTVPPLQI